LFLHIRIGSFLHPGQTGDTDAIFSRLGVTYVGFDEQETGVPQSFVVKLYSFLHSGVAFTQRRLQQKQMPFLWNAHGRFMPTPRLYSALQITKAEDLLGLSRKVAATTA
jgi:hypothetical protein